MPLANLADHAVDNGVVGDHGDADIDELVDVALDKRLRFHGRHHLRAVDGFAVVADAAGAAREVSGEFGVAGSDHRPAVDEDLRADLFGHDLTVQRNGAALGRWIAVL